jgi:hypothetical protein
MIRYRTQPMGYVDGEFTSVINNYQRKKDILANIREYLKAPKDDDIVDMITDASIMSAMILTGDYKNVLVVTSSNPTHSEGDHLIPAIHKFNYGVGKMSVTTPKRLENRFGGLYEDLDVDIVEVDSFYHLGQDKVRMNHDGEPFDAVVLLGNESLTNSKHKLHEIKAVFSPHCTEVFDLIDIYRGSDRTLQGGILPRENVQLVSNIILNEDMSRQKETDKYQRVFHNIESIEQIYKVG